VARLRVALCQLDTAVGDVDANADRIVDSLKHAESAGADVAAFPELTITGYPPEDLLLKPAFVADNLAALERVAMSTSRCVALVGFVDVVGDDDLGDAVARASGAGAVAREAAIRGAPRRLRNALAVCAGGGVLGIYHKRRLPNYGVFDEERWFAPGTSDLELYGIAGVPVGVSICEDLWFPCGPIAEQASAGARLILNINASPFSIGRSAERLAVARERVAEIGCAIAYVNQVGGQDELVFDGRSFVMDGAGDVLALAPAFEESVFFADITVPDADGALDLPTHTSSTGDAIPVRTVSTEPSDPRARPLPPVPAELSEEAEVYGALLLGTRDYLYKTGFADAVVGLSGGIDSSLVATIAVDALGAEHVHALSMPSRYSSTGSRLDAATLAEHLGIDMSTVPIDKLHGDADDALAPTLGHPIAGLTDENLQSRLRGLLLMAVSNDKGWIVLTTGNKSELATGYSTLYGDSAGGFAVIKDVPKTLVYRLCRYRNELAGTDLIPEPVLTKAPSAELRPDQRDQDSLPPYEVLDPLLDALVVNDRSIADVVTQGYPPELVAQVARLVDNAEYKRRQSPPGVRISAKAFGKDRRMPIANRYRHPVPEKAAMTVDAAGKEGQSRDP